MTKFIRILAIASAALLWQSAAHADLDDIRRAAEAGNAEAQLELGILFQYGFKYKDNQIPALTWYILSANQGNAKAAKLRDTLKAQMTEQDAAEAADQAAKYKPTAAAPAAAPAPSAETQQPAPATDAPSADTTPPAQSAPEPAAAPETPPAEAPAPAAAPAPSAEEPAPAATPTAPATK